MKIFRLTIQLFIVAVSIVLLSGCQSAMNSFVETRLKKEAEVINKKADKDIQDGVRVDSASAVGKSIRFNYTMVNFGKGDLDLKIFYKTAKSELIEIANSKEMVFYKKNKVTIAYAYYYKDGTPLTTIIIKPEDYTNSKN
jgi:hypothetical protein